jgi:hypothetical protein
MRQKGCEFKASLGYIARPISKKKNVAWKWLEVEGF